MPNTLHLIEHTLIQNRGCFKKSSKNCKMYSPETKNPDASVEVSLVLQAERLPEASLGINFSPLLSILQTHR